LPDNHAVNRPDSCPIWSLLRVAIFYLALCVPMTVMLIPSLRTWTGTRKPEFPSWSWRVGDMRRYPPIFEEQFNSALPLRVKIAAVSGRLYTNWLRISPIPEVILGTDGWLYYAGLRTNKLLDRDLRGRDPFSQDELDHWRRLLIERTRRFRTIGARYVLVIAPNKESIYPEHLPAWIGPKLGPSRLDQLMAFLKSAPEATVIDLRASLIADKGLEILYYKTDTHWNPRGAHTAYREIARILEPYFPGLSVRSWASFNPKVIERQSMDIARMMGLEFPDEDFKLAYSACAERQPIPIPIPEALQSTTPSPYSTRCHAPGNINAVIFQDSFGWALAPFLEESFRSAANFDRMGWNNAAGYDLSETLKANLVVEILVERNLSTVLRYAELSHSH
jgi:hypothetical protein